MKIDLHTHSIMSNDGSITEKQYKHILEKGILDCVAITDHNRIDFALNMQKQYPEKIIVGEEVKSADGDIIGLFLTKVVPPYLSFEATINAIKEQHGLVLIPHPFSIHRKSTGRFIKTYHKKIDIIELFNPRNMIKGLNLKAKEAATLYTIPGVANSDSHCDGEIGRTLTVVADLPTRDTLVKLLRDGTTHERYTTAWHMLCPRRNRIRKLFNSYEK